MHIRSRASEKSAIAPSNFSFDSGALNRNWQSKYVLEFFELGVLEYDNVALPPWRGQFSGRIIVSDYNCSAYETCTSCLIYPQCMWCSGNNTCIERNATNNMPIDTGVVVKTPFVRVSEGKEYEHAKYMEGYNPRTAPQTVMRLGVAAGHSEATARGWPARSSPEA